MVRCSVAPFKPLWPWPVPIHTLNLKTPPNLIVPPLPEFFELTCTPPPTQFAVPDPQVMPVPPDKKPVRTPG